MIEVNPTEVTGGLTVWMRLTTTKSKTASSGMNQHWRIEVMKAMKLKMIDSLDEDGNMMDANPSPYCEVYWKGPGMCNGERQDIDTWTLVGFTGCRENTINPVFIKEKDNSLFELPPIWTNKVIPRGQYDGHVQEGGGWIACNQVPEDGGDDDAIHDDNDPQKIVEKKKAPTQSREEIISMRALIKYNELIGEELGRQLEVVRLFGL